MRSVRLKNRSATRPRDPTRTALVAASISIALIAFIWMGGMFNAARLRLSDLYFVGSEVSDDIVIVALDDASLNAFGRSPAQWDRSIYADLIGLLSSAGARVVAFDLLFFEPTEQDAALGGALRDARQSDARTRIVLPVAGAESIGVECPDGAPGIAFPTTMRPVAPIANAADYLAYVNTIIDADGVIRRQPSVICADDTRAHSFPLAVYLAMLRVPSAVADQVVTLDSSTLFIAERPALVGDEHGIWRQNFYGRRGVTFPTYSLVDVVEGDVPLDTFADKAVLVGLINSQGAADRYPVPVSTDGQPMAGVEILAHAIQTLVRQDLIYNQSPISVAIMMIMLALASALIYVRVNWTAKVVTMLLILLIFFGIASVNFSLRGEIANVFEGGLAILLPALVTGGFEIRAERLARRQAEILFDSAEGQRKLVDAIFMRSPLAMVLINTGLQVIRVNRNFEAISGSSSPELISRLEEAGLDPSAESDVRAALKDDKHPEVKLKLGETTYLLRTAQIQESDFHVVTLTDVTSLEQLTALKTRLIRIAAHDVRNPLSSVIGFVELLQIDAAGFTERQVNMLNRIKTSGETINTIMSNLLKLEQLRSAALPLEPYAPALLLSQIATSHAPDMERRDHEFVIDIASGLPIVEMEPIQLGQAISNLLSNAAKYTPNGGRITLSGKVVDQKVRITVQDNGYGIPKDAQADLFTEFYRVKTGEAANVAGTGLGLSLVRTIIEAHKGRVWVESEEGKGSTFFVDLPVAAKEGLLLK